MFHKLLMKIYSHSPHFVITSWRKTRSLLMAWKAFWAQRKIDKTIMRLRQVVNRPIRVGFYIVTDSCFQLETVFQKMIGDESFDPRLVVIPSINLSPSDRDAVYSSTVLALEKKYPGSVVLAREGDNFYDVSHLFDIVSTMNPYDAHTVLCYRIEYLARNGIPVFLSRYYQEDGTIWGKHHNELPELSFLWRFYQGNEQVLSDTAKSQKLLSRNHRLVAVGEPKIDRLHWKKEKKRDRKKIILAPHHSIVPIGEVGLQLSNFLKYSDFIIKLPKNYPEIDWVFRPHPFLMSTMVSCGYWTEAERSAWLEELVSYSNVDYMTDGDYYDTFLNSDGLIQDCGSFLPEYFYVNKPQCYVLKSKEHEQHQFTEYGQSLLKHVYRAYSKNDIINFIENIVLEGNDPMQEDRLAFTDKVVKFNYPHASETILEDLKLALGRD